MHNGVTTNQEKGLFEITLEDSDNIIEALQIGKKLTVDMVNNKYVLTERLATPIEYILNGLRYTHVWDEPLSETAEPYNVDDWYTTLDGTYKKKDGTYANYLKKAEVLTRLNAIDIESIRPLRSIAEGTATEMDRLKLEHLDNEAVILRKELATLQDKVIYD